MVTIAILAVIASIAIPAYRGYITTSHKAECQNEIAAIKLAESEYFLDNNKYFDGGNVGELKTNSGSIYLPSSTAAGGSSECDYKVSLNGTTGYLITASPATGSHLVGQSDMTFSGP